MYQNKLKSGNKHQRTMIYLSQYSSAILERSGIPSINKQKVYITTTVHQETKLNTAMTIRHKQDVSLELSEHHTLRF